MTKIGRPPGPTCRYSASRFGNRCKKAARVKVTIRIHSSGPLGYREIVDYRCWEDYVKYENAARSSKAFEILRAEVL